MKKQKLKNNLQHLSLLLLLLGQAKIIHTMEGGELIKFDPTTGTDLTNPTGYDGVNHDGVNHDGGDHDGGGDDGGGDDGGGDDGGGDDGGDDDGGGDDGGDHDGNQQQPGNSTGNQNGGNSGKQNPLNLSLGASPIDGITQGENPVVTSTDAADILNDLHTPSQKPASKSWLPKTVSDFITKVKVAWDRSFKSADYKKAAKGLPDQAQAQEKLRTQFNTLYGKQSEPIVDTFLTEGGVLRKTIYDAITEQLLSALKANPNADPLELLRNIENNPDINRLKQTAEGLLKNGLPTNNQEADQEKVQLITAEAQSYLCIDIESQVKAILKQVKPDLLNRLNDRQKSLENLAEIESAFKDNPNPDQTQLQELLNEARQAVRNSGVPTDLDALTKQYEKTLGKYNDTLQSLRDSSNPSNPDHKTDEEIDEEANPIRRAKKILELLYDATVIELLKARVLKSMESNEPNEQAKAQVDIEQILKVQLKYYSLDELTTRLTKNINSLTTLNESSDGQTIKYEKLVLAHLERNETIKTLLDKVNNMFDTNEPIETIEKPINEIIDLELANGKTIAELRSEYAKDKGNLGNPVAAEFNVQLGKRNWRLPEPNQTPENVPSSPEDTIQEERDLTIKTLKESLQELVSKSDTNKENKNELAKKIIKLELENGTSLENLANDYLQKRNAAIGEDQDKSALYDCLFKDVEQMIKEQKETQITQQLSDTITSFLDSQVTEIANNKKNISNTKDFLNGKRVADKVFEQEQSIESIVTNLDRIHTIINGKIKAIDAKTERTSSETNQRIILECMNDAFTTQAIERAFMLEGARYFNGKTGEGDANTIVDLAFKYGESLDNQLENYTEKLKGYDKGNVSTKNGNAYYQELIKAVERAIEASRAEQNASADNEQNERGIVYKANPNYAGGANQ